MKQILTFCRAHILLMALASVFLFFGASASSAYGADQFSSIIEDLPLMQGMYERTEESVIFDKPSGRFVELITAAPSLARSEVLEFYEDALPALGWTKKTPQEYVLEGEVIKINTQQLDKVLYVTFTLSPRQK